MILVVLVTVAFLGLALAANRMMLSPPAPCQPGDRSPLTRGEPSAWMVVPVAVGLVALLVLGLHPPGELTGLLARAVAQLGGTVMTGDRPRPRRTSVSLASGVSALWDDVIRQVAAGHRFAGLMATQRHGRAAVRAPRRAHGHRRPARRSCQPRRRRYPALTPRLGAAGWYERLIHDLFGIVPEGHPRLAPLVLPQRNGSVPRPVPARRAARQVIEPDEQSLPRHVTGPGLFTIPHGPVRSGVMESIEYLVETPGEDIPHLNMRVFYKHRGIEKRFEGMTAADGVLLAERTEGVASVAHALAYCHAVERMAELRGPVARRADPGAARRAGTARRPSRRRHEAV